MRLIDANALRERIEAWKYYGIFSKTYLIAIIDTAPTVEEKSYAMGYQDGLEDGLDGIGAQAIINGIREIISKNGITTVEELLETLETLEGDNNDED